ncbi:MAG: DNA-processing protein DprA [Clostridia bacterium]|nr:DNA-processing protein DprA [Clostridia bacterium]
MKEIKIIKSTDEQYPQKLLQIKDYPKKLYIIGNEKLLNKDSIGIVGARECTAYGAKYAYKFAEQISKKEICIISGMAIGIDAAAHYGAFKGKGNTIAVLGSGFNYIYPEENLALFEQIIANNGCVISEYEPSIKADLSKFPNRNRIISGLSIGILVVEAKHRSGSTVTARYAKEQEKSVFCIPSNIDLKTGVGTNRLIQKGAKLVTCANDILIELNISSNKEVIQVEEKYINIYNKLNHIPININLIAKKCNLDIATVTQMLLIMEIKGYVKSLPGNEYVRL